MLLTLSLAFAEPYRCAVVWSAPALACQVRGPLRVEATAGSEGAARAASVRQLSDVLHLTGLAMRARSALLSDADFSGCALAAEAVSPLCFPEPALAGFRLCFADLPATECWSGEVLNFEAAPVRALDLGRRQLCDAVDDRIVTQNYTNTDLRRAECRARCEAETRVRCPAEHASR